MDNTNPKIVFTLHEEDDKSLLEIEEPLLAEFAVRWWRDSNTSHDWIYVRGICHGISLMTPGSAAYSDIDFLRRLAAEYAFLEAQKEFAS